MFAKRRGIVMMAIAIPLFLMIGYLAIGKVLGSCLYSALDLGGSICSFDIAAEWNIRGFDQCMQVIGPIDVGWDREKVVRTAGRWERSISTSPWNLASSAPRRSLGDEVFWREVERGRIVQYLCWRQDGPDGEETTEGYGARVLLLFDFDDRVKALWRSEFRWGTPPMD